MSRTPRVKNLRHSEFDRVRYRTRFLAWLSGQATRLSGQAAAIFNLLLGGYSAEDVERATGAGPANTVLPSITGTATSGQTLTAANGTWTGTPTPSLTRRWLADNVVIAGAVGTTFVLTAAQVGKKVSVEVTAKNIYGVQVRTSAQTATVT